MENQDSVFSGVEWKGEGEFVFLAMIHMYGADIQVAKLERVDPKTWKLTVDGSLKRIEYKITPLNTEYTPFRTATELVDFANPVAQRMYENNCTKAQLQQLRDTLHARAGANPKDTFVKGSTIRDALRAEQDVMGVPSHKRMEVTDGGAAMPARIAKTLGVDLSDEPEKAINEPISLQSYRKDH